MESDIRIARIFQLGMLLVALGATNGACSPFGEALGEAPPVDSRRSSDPVEPPADAGDVSSVGDAGAADAGPVPSTTPVPPGGCKGALDCQRVVFVSSISFAAYDLGGLQAADAKCNALATLAWDDRVRDREFVAWLSDGATSPADRLAHGTMPYVRPDGEVIAKDFSALTSAKPLAASISLDEDGDEQEGAVWTGTDVAGTSTGASCSGWIANGGIATRGVITSSAPRWTNAGPPTGAPGLCASDRARIYCFEK